MPFAPQPSHRSLYDKRLGQPACAHMPWAKTPLLLTELLKQCPVGQDKLRQIHQLVLRGLRFITTMSPTEYKMQVAKYAGGLGICGPMREKTAVNMAA
jgi:hypothetical protein